MNTVVVAAGASRRFGYANKLLAPVRTRAGSGPTGRSRPLVVETLDRVLAATRGPVLLVVGHQSRRLLATLARYRQMPRRLRVVRNRRARTGLAGSLGHGLRAAPRLDTALSIHLADLPVFERRIANTLRSALHHGAAAARPSAGARPGHPVRVARTILPSTSDAPDAGLRDALATLASDRFARPRLPARFANDIDTRQMMRNRIWRP